MASNLSLTCLTDLRTALPIRSSDQIAYRVVFAVTLMLVPEITSPLALVAQPLNC